MRSISVNDGVVRPEVKLLFECSNMSEQLPPELLTKISMGGKWGVGKKEMCHRPHGVLITITKHGEQKKLVIGHEKPPTTPT